MTLRFEWDEIKNRHNRSKHGVWFEEAQTVAVIRIISARKSTKREAQFYEKGI